MTRSSIVKLDQLLTGLQQLVLDADALDGIDGADAVRCIISGRLTRKATTSVKGDSSLWRKLSQLAELGVRRPDLRPRLSAVFGSARGPSSEEVDALVDALIKAGELKREQ
jgi:hypothetical protein